MIGTNPVDRQIGGLSAAACLRWGDSTVVGIPETWPLVILWPFGIPRSRV